MLDLNLLTFVEPIGYGQIVDRESLVALPLGSVKLKIANGKNDILVKVMSFKERGASLAAPNEISKRIPIKAYVWQDGVVVSGEECCSEETYRGKYKRGTTKNRPCQQFRFRKHPDHCNYEDIVPGVVQVCVYNFSSTKLQPRKRIFVGTVHIALKCFRCTDHEASMDWYKVFPKSTMLPGSPSEIARDNCYISGEKVIENSTANMQSMDESPKRSSGSIVNSSSESTISFDVFKVKRKTRQRSIRRWFSFSTSPVEKDISEVENDIQQTTFKSRSSKRESICKWLKSQKSSTEISPCSSRLSHESFSTSSSLPPITPPFLVATSSSGSHTTTSKRSSIISSQSMYSNTDYSFEDSQIVAKNDEQQQRNCGFTKKNKNRGINPLTKSISF